MAETAPNPLSGRELEIIERVATGATNQKIAIDLAISINTVKAHLRNIYGKLEVESRTEATRYAIQHGLIHVATPASEAASAEPDTEKGASDPDLIEPEAPRTWPISWAQQAIVVVILVALALVALWPAQRAVSSPATGRMLDAPASPRGDPETPEASRWQARAQMPTPRGRYAVAALDGLIYAVAGLTDEGWSQRVEVYDPQQDLWGRRADKPTAVANVGAAVVNGLIYVPGGLHESGAVRDLLEIYDPASDAWSSGPSLPTPVCAYAIAPYGEGFYVMGGWDGEGYLDTVFYFDASTGSWTLETPMRIPRGFAGAATVEERIYLLGGYDGVSEYALCESYAPELARAGENPWLTHSPMKMGRAGHSVSPIEGSLYVVGGGWEQPFTFNERYDVRNDIWSTFQSPITGEWRTLGTAPLSATEGTYLYAMGGWDGAYLGLVRVYRATYRVFLP